MAIHIRNCRLPTQTALNRGAPITAFFLREALLIGGWTEDSNDGDAAWASALNIIIDQAAGANGFTVAAANPRQIIDQGGAGRFTQAMVDNQNVIALRGSTNDQNYSMWRIVEFINMKTIKVDPVGFSPIGWADEVNMAGRVLEDGLLLLNSSWDLMDAPSGNNQARFDVNTSAGTHCFSRPRGQLADPTEAPASDLVVFGDDDDLAISLNAYLDGPNALFYQFSDGDGLEWMVLWGEFDVADAVADPSAGFVMELNATSFDHDIYCLNFAAAVESAEPTIPKRYDSQNASSSFLITAIRMLINGRPGRAGLYKPLAWMVGDKFLRGNIPIVRFCNKNFGSYRRFDAAGLYRHTKDGRVVPMNGPLDQPLIMTGA